VFTIRAFIVSLLNQKVVDIATNRPEDPGPPELITGASQTLYLQRVY